MFSFVDLEKIALSTPDLDKLAGQMKSDFQLQTPSLTFLRNADEEEDKLKVSQLWTNNVKIKKEDTYDDFKFVSMSSSRMSGMCYSGRHPDTVASCKVFKIF